MTERGGRALFAALALAWAGAIFWASSRPNPFPFLPRGLLTHDKLVHLAAYAVLAGLAVGALARTRLGAARGVVAAAVLAAGYGATDEWHQGHVPGRDADPVDLAAAAAGAIGGAAAAAVILRGRGARASIRA
jgi:VanZ family protein